MCVGVLGVCVCFVYVWVCVCMCGCVCVGVYVWVCVVCVFCMHVLTNVQYFIVFLATYSDRCPRRRASSDGAVQGKFMVGLLNYFVSSQAEFPLNAVLKKVSLFVVTGILLMPQFKIDLMLSDG